MIILAHPERQSFNACWARQTENASQRLGHKVIWSDLYAMQFDPVEHANHYHTSADTVFDVLKAQESASATSTLPNDVTNEIDKLRSADRLVFHFPLWWFAPPAMLKGWCDRVFVHGATHTVDNRFDRGKFNGKRALFCVTTGSTANESNFNGKEGDIGMLLWPLAYTLRYLGFSILVPCIAHGVHGYFSGAEETALQSRLHKLLQDHHQTMGDFDVLPEIAFNKDTDFDIDGKLLDSADCHSYFIRKEP
jgi:NAD(P)H dehydrogenase (quinone)